MKAIAFGKEEKLNPTHFSRDRPATGCATFKIMPHLHRDGNGMRAEPSR